LAIRGDIYVILLGVNDAQDGTLDSGDGVDPYLNVISVKEDFVPCYQRIIDGIRVMAPEAKIFMGIPAPVMDCIWPRHQEKYLLELLPYYQELAERNPDVCLIDIHKAFMDLAGEERLSFYSGDRLHPNAKGLELIAKKVCEAIVK